MSKITRKHQKIFGGSLVPTNNLAQFGSLKAGSIAYSDDPDTIQGLSAYLNGWASAVVNNNAPALQDRNALDFLFSRQLAYLMQTGIAEWNTDTIYYTGSLATDSNGTIYRSIDDDNEGNALTDDDYWQCLGLSYIGTNPQVGGSTPFQMTVGNNRTSILNPSSNITVKLPTTDIIEGEPLKIINRSTYTITIQSSDASAVDTIEGVGMREITPLQDTPTSNSHWLVTSLEIANDQIQNYTGLKKFLGGVSDVAHYGADPQGTESPANVFTLTASHKRIQVFTPDAQFTIVLPSTGIKAGESFTFYNQSTTYQTLFQSSDGSPLTKADGANMDSYIYNGYVKFKAKQDTPTTENHWEVVEAVETTPTFSCTTTGPFTTNTVFSFTRVNNMVTCSIVANISGTSVSGTPFTIDENNIPTRMKPASNRHLPILVESNSVKQMGKLIVKPDGSDWNIYADPAESSFAGANTAGFKPTDLNWSI